MPSEAPPMGIEPRFVWLEKRRDALYDTINGHRKRLISPKIEWLEELVKLEKEIQEIKITRK